MNGFGFLFCKLTSSSPSGYVRMSINLKVHLQLYQIDFSVDFQNQCIFLSKSQIFKVV